MKLIVIVFQFSTFFHVATCYNLTIIHTNDVHARFVEAHKYGGVCSDRHQAAGDCVGGVSRRKTIIDQIRREKPNTLLLDGGDLFQGTFWFLVYQGTASAYFMKKLGYDAMAIGNHEFDLKIPGLQRFINNVSDTFDVLSSNIKNPPNQNQLTGYKPYVIKEVNGRKIGIIGYTTADTPILTPTGATGELIFDEVIASVRNAVRDLKADDPTVNIIIALGHAGFETDKLVAKEVDDVDLVVGGHSNTFLYTGDKLPAGETPSGPYPYVVDKNDGKKALCVQAFYFSKYLGNLEVDFDFDGEIVKYGGNPILLDSTVAKDPEMEELLKPFEGKILEEGNVPLGTTLVELAYEMCRKKECNIGNLLSDSWIHTNAEFTTDNTWARASVALANGGSIRAPILKGNITTATLLTAVPFGNTVVAIRVNGSTLKSVLEHSIAVSMSPKDGGFLQMSGIHVTYDKDKPEGNRVMDVEVRCLKCAIPRYEPLDAKEEYSLLTTSFLASGGDGYSMLQDGTIHVEDLGFSESDMLAEYIQQVDKVYPAEEGRIKFVDSGKRTEQECNSASTSFSLPLSLLLATLAITKSLL